MSRENLSPQAPAPRPKTHRLFFAIWPDEAESHLLHSQAARIDPGPAARAIAPQSLHLTLAFLGEVEPQQIPALITLALALPRPQGKLMLDHISSFKKGGIIWAGTHERPAALINFVAALHEALRAQGFALEAREFVPHVTVFRNGRWRGVQQIEAPLPWQIDGMRLVESVPGGGYLPLWRDD